MNEKAEINLVLVIIVAIITVFFTVAVITLISIEPIYNFRIVDQNDNPLQGASVKIISNEEEFRTVSDPNVEFTLSLPNNQIRIKIIKPGYEIFDEKISISNEKLSVIELKEVSEEPVRKSLRVFTGEEIYFGELNAL